jgi:Flp pilus assembly protein TadD
LRADRRFEESVEILTRGLELAPDNINALMQLGVSCLKLGKTDEAERAFKQILARAPDHKFAQAWVLRLKSAKPSSTARS